MFSAHDALMEVRIEDEDPDEQEYGALETRKDEIGGALAEAIVNRTRDRDAQELHQQKQAELDRQHQIKLDEVAASRLRLASLHAV